MTKLGKMPEVGTGNRKIYVQEKNFVEGTVFETVDSAIEQVRYLLENREQANIYISFSPQWQNWEDEQ